MDTENTNPFVTPLTVKDFVHRDVVPRDYKMQPETEELIYGSELRDGMVVLVESPNQREYDGPVGKYFPDLDKLLVTNRWCRVTKVREAHMVDASGGVVIHLYFIGVYANGGVQALRRSMPFTGWLVKKDSIPKEVH